VARQTVHTWLRRYAEEGMGGLADRPSRPVSCPHQVPAQVEARIVGMRREHPGWGPSRIRFELERAGVVPLPGRSAVYRALVRHGLVAARKRRRRREDYRRWERPRAMDLWQMDVMGRVFLADGAEVKIVTGIDDQSRFAGCAKAVMRAHGPAGLPGAEGGTGPARDPGAGPHRQRQGVHGEIRPRPGLGPVRPDLR
jgi:transposase